MSMLRRYRFKNFYSFEEETIVSFEMNKNVPESDLICSGYDDHRVSKVLAVIGPNASGKTNLIKPIAFLNWFITRSFYEEPDKPIPVQSHFFSDNPVSEFEIEFDYQETLWRYQLTVTRERVIREALFNKKSRLYSYVFERDWDQAAKGYKVKQKNFGFSQKDAEKTKENASLLSTAAHQEVSLATRLTNTCIFSNVNAHGREHLAVPQLIDAADFYFANPTLLKEATALLKKWDFGLSDIQIEKRIFTDKSGGEEEQNFPVVIHSCGEKEAKQVLMTESSGTQGAFLLLSKVLPALATGGLAVIDELESDLHPHMIEPIINLFCDKETNRLNAQIIFTCHTIEVLNLLNKAQVMLVGKKEDCTSEAWRLDSVKGVRSDDNLYAKYMAGAYGAIPDL